jgi:hypothetical protein
MKSPRSRVTRLPKRIATTLGELIAAAYEAAPGLGADRMERAARLLMSSRLAQALSRPVRFVR